jgi:dihydroorotase
MLIRGGRVLDPAQPLDAICDLRLADGRIVELSEHLAPLDGEEIFDAHNAFVAPGFIDMHVHLRDPGFPEKETIATGTLAAVRGGFTAVACMPNTDPALDDPRVLEDLLRREASCRVYPIAAITRGRKGRETLDYAALAAAGAVAFSDDGNTVMSETVLRDAALRARNVPGVFISHAIDEDMHADAVMHEGAVSRALGLPGSPAIAEDSIVARDLAIAKETSKPWHIAHVSTATSLALIIEAKREAVAVTCEVTPHHLLLTDEAVRDLGAAAKVNPPLRAEADARALREAVLRGDIDAFATDHAPHTQAEKSGDIRDAAVGFSGLEIAIGAYALAIPDLPSLQFVALLSTNPARILGVPGGSLAVGSPADITIFADRPRTVDSAQFASKGKSTPFEGRTLPRCVLATVVGGEIRYRA